MGGARVRPAGGAGEEHAGPVVSRPAGGSRPASQPAAAGVEALRVPAEALRVSLEAAVAGRVAAFLQLGEARAEVVVLRARVAELERAAAAGPPQAEVVAGEGVEYWADRCGAAEAGLEALADRAGAVVAAWDDPAGGWRGRLAVGVAELRAELGGGWPGVACGVPGPPAGPWHAGAPVRSGPGGGCSAGGRLRAVEAGDGE